MISPELSMIQRNKERSAVLEAEVAEFLKSGGVIATLQGFAYKPRPYGRMGAAATPAPRRRTKEAMRAAAPPPPEPNLPRGHVSDEVVAQIRHMAQTTTITDVSRNTGISHHMLRKIAAEHRFEYKRFDPSPALSCVKAERIDPVADALNVLRIKEARDRGLSRYAAKNLIGISSTLMERLIADFNIDYPVNRIYRK
ncbi:hypothetical protein NLO72_23990 [Pseudomonas tremae]|uniref:hypothetical protein n=1 Tax=Pseudomonas syringae group TaxID=136849 RepID=UPI000EFF9B28|nr:MULTISPECIES: hypothetical protein [Pseudomonas syringae group]MCQ2992264.1 hypothetical protein [Pseudomonas tremae]RMV64722.1 hypothetical protein ALP06_02765 [Pseudomonas coronafaciens pv. atropurpurea]